MRSQYRTRTHWYVSLAIALTGWALLAAPGALGASTDVSAMSLNQPNSPLTVLGGSVVPFAVRNTSGVRARRLAVTIVLSKDKRRDARDAIVAGGAPRALAAGARRTLRVALAVPTKVKPGSYWLVACVTAGRQVQSSKSNDCVATARKVAVRAATVPVVPVVTALPQSAVSKVIGAAGGTVTTPEGFTLTVPAESLSLPTTIRLVPVASLSPGPRGATPILSVIIEPEGLLVPGATIDFKLPAGFPAKGLTGIVFGGEDEAIVRAPFIRGKGLRLDATTFGGYGVGALTQGLKLPTSTGGGHVATAADPCAAESLRKRADEIVARVNPRTIDEFVTVTEALVQFEQSSVIPAMNAAVAAGATADDLSPIISLALSIERQAQLLGVESPVSIVAEVAKALKKAAANEIKKCADGGQGPLKTQTAIYSLARGITLLGGGDVFAELQAKLESDCLSKPYLLTYEMTTDEMLNTAPRPPGAVSGRVFINDLPVPVPRPGADAAAALGPMNSSNLTCDLGVLAFVIACQVNTVTVDLEAKIIGTKGSTKAAQRCGRTVQVPIYEVVIQLRHPTDQAQLTITFQIPPGPPLAQPASGGSGFDRALSVATEGEMQQVTLPDDGGNEQLLGSTDNFHGSMLKIFAIGTATLKLKA